MTEFDDLLTEKARALIEDAKASKTTSDALGDGAALYAFPGPREPPTWAAQLKEAFVLEQQLYTQRPCAIVAFRKGGHVFAVTFSHGHLYVDDAKTEANFGLKTAVNVLSDGTVRGVEQSNIADAIRKVAQAATQRDVRSFGFDDALDVIRKVTGNTSEDDFADKVTGSRSLRFSKKIDIREVPEAALLALRLFHSQAYKATSFRVIDLLAPVLDSSVQALLDDALVDAIRKGSDEFELSLPEILPDDVGSFRFERVRASRFHPDLSLELYRNDLGNRLKQLTLDDLKNHRVAAHDLEGDKPARNWSVYHSLVGLLF